MVRRAQPPSRRVLLVVACLLSLFSTGWAPHAELPPEIVVTQLHMFVTRAGDWVRVTEYYLVSNSGDQVYEGTNDPESGRRLTLTFSVPQGAEGLSFDGPGLGERFFEVDGGFADTEPIAPGVATVGVLFSYQLRYSDGLRIDRTFYAPVDSVVLLAAEGGLALEGSGVRSEGTLDTELGPALSYTAGPIASGETLALTVVAGPREVPAAPALALPARSPTREAAIGLVSLAAALAFVYFVWRSPKPAGPPPPRVRPLVEKIAALDADFEAGSLPEDAYRQRRRSLKGQARRLLE